MKRREYANQENMVDVQIEESMSKDMSHPKKRKRSSLAPDK